MIPHIKQREFLLEKRILSLCLCPFRLGENLQIHVDTHFHVKPALKGYVLIIAVLPKLADIEVHEAVKIDISAHFSADARFTQVG